MTIWDKWAKGINKVATGDKKRRAILTPIATIFLFGILTLFVFCSFWVDRWLNLPHLPDAWWRYTIAAVIFIAGLFLVLSTVIAFSRARGTPLTVSPPPELVTTGLFAYTRNPMVLGDLLILEGVGFFFGSLSLIVFFAPLPVVLYALYIKAVEEPELEMRFGKAYVEYKKRVPMFIPRCKRQS
ncbi:MAG TPA: isoprenylcysteine carboxylmethyltransferase family protein [Dehalococcoidia bacterium]